MKRIFCCLMAIVTVLSVLGSFVGCNKDGESEEDNAPKLAIVENGASNYVMVYPTISTSSEQEAVKIIRDKINDVTGVRLETVSEEFLSEYEGKGKNYIYIGDTTLEAAIAAKEDISAEYFNAYDADTSGEDIYFVAASDTAIYDVATYYAENLVEKNYDSATKTLYFEGCYFEGSEVNINGFSKAHIREYVIIYPENWLEGKEQAKRLKGIIDAKTETSINIYSDAEMPERKYEILIGETNRALSARCYEGTSRMMEFEYVVDQCKLQLAYGGCYTAEKSMSEFARLMLSSDEAIMSGNYHRTEYAKTTLPITSGADVRIMTANILAYRWGESKNSNVLPAAQRAEIFAGVLLNYSPDAVGAQELDEPWKQALPWYLERMASRDDVEYSYIHSTASVEEKTMINFSAILYRSDMYNLDESECRVFSIWEMTPNYFQRVASYAKFSAKDNSGKEFALVNTHWAHEDRETVDACAVEQAAFVNSIKEKHKDITVFCTGDYNNLTTREWVDEYLNQFVGDIDGTIASVAAKEKGVLITPGGCITSAKNMRENILRPVDNRFIDHVIYSGAPCDVMRHDTIRDNGCNILSDHCPVYADIDLK